MADQKVNPIILVVGGVAVLAVGGYAIWSNFLADPGADDFSQDPSVEIVDYPDEPLPEDGMPGEGEYPEDMMTEDPYLDDELPLPETFEVYTARNPFESLIKKVSLGTDTAPPSDYPTDLPTTPPSTPPTDGSQPSANPSVQPSENISNSTGTGQEGQVEVGATRIRFQSAQAPDKATIAVNGVEYNPTVGEVFADRLKLLSIDTDNGRECGTILFGDSRLELCAGQFIDK